jgi:hypothetical protein
MSLLKNVKKKLIHTFGEVNERTINDYWQQYGYSGPFSQKPQGKFFLNAPLEEIHQYVGKLKPYIRNNEIIGVKHSIVENQPGDLHFGKPPVFIVYTTKKKKKSVEDILEKEGIKGTTWTEENPTIRTSELMWHNQ